MACLRKKLNAMLLHLACLRAELCVAVHSNAVHVVSYGPAPHMRVLVAIVTMWGCVPTPGVPLLQLLCLLCELLW